MASSGSQLLGYTALLLLLAVVAWSTGCKQDAGSAPQQMIPQVEVVTVATQTVVDEPEFIGQSESSRPVEIRSQVTGILKDRFFIEGRDVQQDDLLYQIDPVPFQAAVTSAKAMVAQAEARLVQAKQDSARVKPLLAEQAVSQKDVDDAVAGQLAAKADLEAAKGELVKAQFDLDNTMIRAPISGMIERTKLYEGRLVSAQDDLLTVIHQLDPMYVIASVPESYLLQRRREMAAHKVASPGIYQLRGAITFADSTTYEHEGKLDVLDVGIRTDTGSRQARFVFPNPDRVLLPGQFVKVRVKGYTKPSAILVPQRAVQPGPKGPMVFVVGEENKIEMRPVQATSWQGTQWLVEGGLREGERVVVAGLHRLAPGATVNPVEADSADRPTTAPVPSVKTVPATPSDTGSSDSDGMAPESPS